MSLYRTYRPTTFADVAGQDHIVETLTQAVKQDKLAHAYLFAGTRGTGKTSIARILAKDLLIRGVTDETIKKNILQAVDEGNLVDLIEIDAASNRGIDDIRSLLEKIQFTPVVAGAKVYIIDEVHMLTREAFNALLKTLEEPPSYAYFILATTELHKIPATIQSRCQRFLFRQIREEDIVKRLQYIADSEHIEVERNALRAVAHHAGGSLRDAISLLDQLRSLPSIKLEDVKERIGETGHEYLEQILTAIASGDRAAIVAVVRSMEEAAIPMETFTRLLLAHVRSELHAAVAADKDPGALLLLLDRLMETVKDLRIAPVPALVLESALLSLSGVAMPETDSAKIAPTVAHSPTPLPEKKVPVVKKEMPEEEEMKATTVMAPELSLTMLKDAWPTIIESAEPAFVRMSLKNGQLHAIEGNTVIIRFGSAFHRDKASSGQGGHAVQDALERHFKKPLKIKYMLDADLDTQTSIPEGESVNIAEAASEVF